MSKGTRVGQPDPNTDSTALQQFGVLPWRTRRDGKMRILLITSRRRGRWIIPKGWPIENQPPVFAASREAFEEAGIIGDINPGPLTDYLYMKVLDDGSVEPCRVTVFGMRVHGTLSTWREQEQRQRRWFSVEEAADRLDDAGLADFVLSNCRVPPSTKVQVERCPDGL
ncbi:NUDIX hydrolase [Microbaculum sp. FT89]|uniref:NUDIX hydrolase n=1 Tax=Microbaculum sp. FT89 TaxID=3447298 RepID=UPI003F5389E9